MNKLLLIALLCLLNACASQTTTQSTNAQQQQSAALPPTNDAQLKIGMTRAEAEQLLGPPSSVTDTADASVLVWIFDPGANKAQAPASNSPGVFSQIGGIAATVLGLFNPIAGVATSVGSQVYNVSQNSRSDPVSPEDSRSITLEVKTDKIVSIQRAHAPASARR